MSLTRRTLVAAALTGTAAATAQAAGKAKSTASMPMRRNDRELSEAECLTAVSRTPHAALGTVDAAGIPYTVPVTPVYLNGKFYFHCSRFGGRRTENLRQNPNVSLCFIAKQDTVQPEFAVNYVSVIVAGKAREITSRDEIHRLQVELCKHHCPEVPLEKIEAYFTKSGAAITMWEITPSRITGKSRNKHLYFGAAKS